MGFLGVFWVGFLLPTLRAGDPAPRYLRWQQGQVPHRRHQGRHQVPGHTGQDRPVEQRSKETDVHRESGRCCCGCATTTKGHRGGGQFHVCDRHATAAWTGEKCCCCRGQQQQAGLLVALVHQQQSQSAGEWQWQQHAGPPAEQRVLLPSPPCSVPGPGLRLRRLLSGAVHLLHRVLGQQLCDLLRGGHLPAFVFQLIRTVLGEATALAHLWERRAGRVPVQVWDDLSAVSHSAGHSDQSSQVAGSGGWGGRVAAAAPAAAALLPHRLDVPASTT